MAEPEKSQHTVQPPPGAEFEKTIPEKTTHEKAASENGTTPTPDIEAAPAPLARKLQGRHMQMIAIGGSIGERAGHDCLGDMLTLTSKAPASSSDQVRHSRAAARRL
jgi:hypothetical protein